VDAGDIGTDKLHSVTLAWGDYDGDHNVDLFVGFYTYQTESEPHRLYHNNGDGTFTRVLTGGIADDMETSNAWAGVWADFENDGDMDLFVAQGVNLGSSSPDRLYLNNGDGTFVRAGQEWIIDAYTMDAAWADHDNDGLIDLFVTSDQTTFLYHRQPDGSMGHTEYPDLTDTAISGVTWSDYDNDNDPDLFISQSNSVIYRNDGNGVFTPDPLPAEKPGVALATADYDNDGDLDLAKCIFRGERLQLFQNDGQGGMVEVPGAIAMTEDYFGFRNPLWADYDNDGYIDLFIPSSSHPDDRLLLISG
jgi:hypothetical protein